MLSLNPSIWEIWCPRRQQRLAFPPKNAFVHSCLASCCSSQHQSWEHLGFSVRLYPWLKSIISLKSISTLNRIGRILHSDQLIEECIISIAPKCFHVRMFQIDRFKYPIFQRPIERPSHTQPTSVLITREWAWEISQLAFDKPTQNCSSFLRINVGYI